MMKEAAVKFDIEKIRADFPVLTRKVHGKDLVFLDSAASSQKPKQVVEAIANYYLHEHANIHRGVHLLSQEATTKYEEARKKIARFINAQNDHECIITKGTTDGINLVASSLGEHCVKEGDEVIISHMEHHSNLVPWQMLCERKKAKLKVIPITDDGELDLEEYEKLLSEKTKIVSVVHVSNTLGTINPVEEMIEKAHDVGAYFVVDGAQAVPHIPVDVQQLNCDFYAFSLHKMYGPTGIGILYGKEEIMNGMPPYQGGGDMINKVTLEKTTYNDLPHKFEAGTPNIAGGIGMGATIDYIDELDWKAAHEFEADVMDYAHERLSEIEGLRFIGTAEKKTGAISFLVGQIHPYDMGVLLDQLGIAVRTGHHCTQPILERYNIPGTVRASFGIYSTKQEVDQLVKGVERAKRMLG
ncbi:MAG: cysteine desulfurase [Salibacter sp.]|nr:cysteine desulfurase [Salibacter sp.]MDR9397609.1 cysteine desulfurase [Salibacter sp.]MDR9486764.1 cysteine desulfurase [Salibacter sp.]